MNTKIYLDSDSNSANHVRRMLSFIENSPSCFHVISNLKEMLEKAGFQELDERDEWQIHSGGKYYVIRNDSSMIAFQMPEGKPKGFHMVASHSDSPTFKIKECPELASEKHYVSLNTDKYGGMILSTWMDRPLSVAGRVAVLDKNSADTIMTRLVNIDRDLLVIPNVAIHMNRDMNKGVEYNPQTDMIPLYAECTDSSEDVKNMLKEEIAESIGVDAGDILGYDLFLYVREPGRAWGRKGEFVLSPKLDDLQCVYASAEAFANSSPKDYISLCAVFDNEEVGSGTRQGADSTFLDDVVYGVCDAMGLNNDIRRIVANSFLISADNAHAVHPNHPEKADPTNRPYLNGGIVIKYHGNMKYTTDAVSGAIMKNLCRKADVPYQTYANRSDIPGGSTLGNISISHVSIPTVDIGLPQLAMHSAVETGGCRDTEYAIRVFKAFFEE